MSDTTFEYIFPAIRGVQAGREYYVSMCPLRLIPKIFLFDEEELVPELRSQRMLNKNRVPDITRYLIENKDSYVFSALTASIDGEVRFAPVGGEDSDSRIGSLHVNMQSQFIINDGQHRRAAIQLALIDEPCLGDEAISVVFFIDRDLQRCQQMFADLNRYAIRPSKSLGLLYDHRDDRARLARDVVASSEAFCDLVENEKSSLSPRSRKLFTLSAIYSGNTALLANRVDTSYEEAVDICVNYWDEIGKHIAEWRLVRESKISSGDVRRDFIHSHAIVLQALGHVGADVYGQKDWRSIISQVSSIDWRRSNLSQWEGRAMIGGQVSKARNNVTLTSNLIKKHLGIRLSEEQQKVEDAFIRSESARKAN